MRPTGPRDAEFAAPRSTRKSARCGRMDAVTAAEGPVPPGAGGAGNPRAGGHGGDGFSTPTYHGGSADRTGSDAPDRRQSPRTPPAGTGGVTVTRAVLTR